MTQPTPATLGSAVSITKGKKHEVSISPSNKAKRLVGIDDLRNDDLIRYTDDAVGVEAIPEDVLIAWDGANAGTIGFGKRGYIGSTIARLRVRKDTRLFAPFLGTYLKSKFEYLRQTATGATIPHINRIALEGIPLPAITYDDQTRIAQLLGKVDGLIAERKQHLQQIDALHKSVFLEMFGDPLRNEKGWDKPALRAFGKISTGNTPPRNNAVNYDDPYVEWIKTDNIVADAVFVTQAAEYLSETGANRARMVDKDALLVACIAGSVESIGRAALTDRTVAFNQQINAIQPAKDVDSLFLYVLFKLCRRYIQSHATKGMKKILTKGDFEQIPMVKPPFELQRSFANSAEKIEALSLRYQQSLADLETLYAALSQQAFKGELDLSRIPLPALVVTPPPAQVKVSASGVTVVIRDSLAQYLPGFDYTAERLATTTGLHALLDQWLPIWCDKLGSDEFSTARFIEAAQYRLEELHPDAEFELGSAAQELVKQWVFKALAEGKLSQTFDEASKRVQLKAAQA
jgi:type I restriction enzyme S subunit